MVSVTVEMVKELRERTGAGIKECKDILNETNGDMQRAIEHLRAKGIEDAGKKQHREASEGRIEVYIHPGSRLVAMVELNCETDFVARTDDFIHLSHELAMHIAAANPQYLSIDQVPSEDLNASHLSEEQFYEEFVLLAQPYVKDPSQTIEEKIKQGIAKLGENIVIRRFTRYEVGVA
ncbi:MAG: elongation factor Ts [Chloroflexaceae bacterium]|nr:elongation factor Ts [Chloroflexaceae bacterium]